ncbi:unnamed protein product, partial [Mesorhabditis spiculigera]
MDKKTMMIRGLIRPLVDKEIQDAVLPGNNSTNSTDPPTTKATVPVVVEEEPTPEATPWILYGGGNDRARADLEKGGYKQKQQGKAGGKQKPAQKYARRPPALPPAQEPDERAYAPVNISDDTASARTGQLADPVQPPVIQPVYPPVVQPVVQPVVAPCPVPYYVPPPIVDLCYSPCYDYGYDYGYSGCYDCGYDCNCYEYTYDYDEVEGSNFSRVAPLSPCHFATDNLSIAISEMATTPGITPSTTTTTTTTVTDDPLSSTTTTFSPTPATVPTAAPDIHQGTAWGWIVFGVLLLIIALAAVAAVLWRRYYMKNNKKTYTPNAGEDNAAFRRESATPKVNYSVADDEVKAFTTSELRVDMFQPQDSFENGYNGASDHHNPTNSYEATSHL